MQKAVKLSAITDAALIECFDVHKKLVHEDEFAGEQTRRVPKGVERYYQTFQGAPSAHILLSISVSRNVSMHCQKPLCE